ncbi:MAG: DUF3347 domain-containing protein, partial [Ferruginibacter sp.]
MKKILLFAVTVMLFATVQHSFAQDTAKANRLSNVLNLYFDIKNALVATDPLTASSKADEFIKAIENVEPRSLNDQDQKAFVASKEHLQKDAQKIASTNKIDLQRTSFSSLSNNVYELAKAARLSPDPIYQQYCPMKKVYWLSPEAAIKNPYYGKSMLTCGN